MHRILRLGVLSAALTLATVALAPGAEAGHHRCLQPNRVDDTAALEAALERCSGARRPCVVSLCKGLFRIAPVRVADFRGELKGAGRKRTIIQALPELEVVNDPDEPSDYFRDDPFGTPWPYLLQFFGGEGEIHDLTVKVPTPAKGQRPTLGWFGSTIFELDGAILITTGVNGAEAEKPVDFDVERVRIVAGRDPLSVFGTTLLNGIFFQGRVFNPADEGSYPVYPVRGEFSLSNSQFRGMLSGSPVAETDGARVSIRGNLYHSGFALHVQDGSHSRLWIVENEWRTRFGGVQILMNVDGVSSVDNTIVAYGNTGSTLVPESDWGTGIMFLDPLDPTRVPGGSTLLVGRNDLKVDTTRGPALSGIDAVGAGRLLVWSNVLRGKASLGGVHVDATSRCRVLFNSLRTVAGPDLVLGPGTLECLAIVGRRDRVIDQGVDNRILRR